MFYFLISLQLLWMIVSGHSISKLQIGTPPSDVYEIKEDKLTNSVIFVHPKSEDQKLREIVYYHLIERPYSNKELVEESKEGPDFDETLRPFTNSHGFQFLESIEKESEQSSVEEEDPTDEEYLPSDDGSNDDDVDEEGDVIYEYYEEEIEDGNGEPVSPEVHKEIQTTEASKISIETTTKPNGETDAEIIKDKTEEIPVKINAQAETTSAPEGTTQMEEDVETANEENLENKAKQARKLLFNQARERYNFRNNKNQDDPSPDIKRRKRQVTMDIPEGPRLGPINFDLLPPYLRQLISTESPQSPQPRSRIFEPSSEEHESLEDIRHKMEEIIEHLDDRSQEVSKEVPRVPRTYGMNLTADHGYVWNDLLTEPGTHFNVETSGSHEEVQIPGINEVTPNDETKNRNHPDITEPIEHDCEHDHKKPEEHDVEVINENKHEGEKNSDEDFNKKDDDYHQDDDDGRSKHEDENSNEVKPSSKLLINDEEQLEDMARRRDKDKDKDIESMMGLLNNKLFWKWLTDWTAVYMDVLNNHIKETVQKEVEAQIQKYMEAHKDDNKTPPKVDEKHEPAKEPNTESNERDSNDNKKSSSECGKDKETDKDKTTNKEDKDEKDIDEVTSDIEKDEKGKDKDSHKDKDEKDIEEDKKDSAKEENQKDIDKIDEPKEDSEKTDEEQSNEELLRRRKDKKDGNGHVENNKHKKQPFQVEAQNIYGNSVGSDKVTNIFIFYPNSDSDKLLSNVKNDTESAVTVFGTPVIDERINVPDKENEKKPTEILDKKESDKIVDNPSTKAPSEKHEIEKEDTTTKSPVPEEIELINKETITESAIELTTTIKPSIDEKIEENATTEKVETSTIENKEETSKESIKDEPKNETSEDENKDASKEKNSDDNLTKDNDVNNKDENQTR